MLNELPRTLSVPEAGSRYLGLSRNASYAAASRGELPVIRIGRLLRVPVRAWSRCSIAHDKQSTRRNASRFHQQNGRADAPTSDTGQKDI